MTTISSYDSPLGKITLASRGCKLVGLWFDGQKYDRAGIEDEIVEGSDDAILQARRWLDIYFSGKNPEFLPPLETSGSEFRRMVAEIMLSIPYGETVTYGQIAREIALRTGKEHVSAQAVGGAVGHNPISIIIPCHRVLGSNGSLTGYAGGIDRKRTLLQLEGILL